MAPSATMINENGKHWQYAVPRRVVQRSSTLLFSREKVDDEAGILPSEPGYGFLSPICFATAASSILVGRSLGRVQFLKRCGTTA
jgi:hypothetical protein